MLYLLHNLPTEIVEGLNENSDFTKIAKMTSTAKNRNLRKICTLAKFVAEKAQRELRILRKLRKLRALRKIEIFLKFVAERKFVKNRSYVQPGHRWVGI